MPVLAFDSQKSLSRGLIRGLPSRQQFCATKPQLGNSFKSGLLASLRISPLLGAIFVWCGVTVAKFSSPGIDFAPCTQLV